MHLPDKGFYLLIISVRKDIRLRIGSLGEMEFKKGRYAYAGSAQRALPARLCRHLKSSKKLFWHIDYLLKDENVSLTKVFVFPASAKVDEHKIIRRLLAFSCQPVLRFGSSDCKFSCPAHLVRLQLKISLSKTFPQATALNSRQLKNLCSFRSSFGRKIK